MDIRTQHTRSKQRRRLYINLRIRPPLCQFDCQRQPARVASGSYRCQSQPVGLAKWQGGPVPWRACCFKCQDWPTTVGYTRAVSKVWILKFQKIVETMKSIRKKNMLYLRFISTSPHNFLSYLNIYCNAGWVFQFLPRTIPCPFLRRNWRQLPEDLFH